MLSSSQEFNVGILMQNNVECVRRTQMLMMRMFPIDFDLGEPINQTITSWLDLAKVIRSN